MVKGTRIRALIVAGLKRRVLGATGSFPVPLNEQPGAEKYFDRGESYPNAKYVSERVGTLPLHKYVMGSDVENMIGVITKELSR